MWYNILGSLVILGNLFYDSQTILDMISEETMKILPIVAYVAPQAHERGRQKATVVLHIGMVKTDSVNLWQADCIFIHLLQVILQQRGRC